MAYICEKCKKPQPAKTPMHRMVVETRKVIYVLKSNEEVEGSEIVKEIGVCPPCRILLTPKGEVKVEIKPSDIRKAERASRKRKLLAEDEEESERIH